MRASLRLIVPAAALALAWSCTVKKADNPPAAGPSELALSLSLAANPDTLTQDGASQSEVVIQARDPNGQPVPGVGIRADIVVDGLVQDFGRLNTKTVVTGSNGRASLIYTAPDAVDGGEAERLVAIRATPVGNDASAQLPRTVSIRLVAPGVINPPGPAVPDFDIEPEIVFQDEIVIFDASDSDLDDLIADYDWDFGDGSHGSGRVVEHSYDDAGNYAVTLTVTDKTGLKASRPKAVEVLATIGPEAQFTFSPAQPMAGDTVFFNASESTASSGRTIVSYTWNFGTSTGTVSGKIVSRVFNTSGTYTVTLTVRDDAGQTASTSSPVTIN